MRWILHHYDFSNFSEKARLILGFKGIAWDSVDVPATLPKPDYLPLTGGYRRAPALQIGADVYCDTRLIAEVVEAAVPTPSLYPGGERNRALAHGLADWAESRMLWPAALYITGINAERFPDSFHEDRANLHRKPVPSVEQVKASARKYLGQLRGELSNIEALFADENPYVLGETASLADLIVYHVPWFLDKIDPGHGLLDKLGRTRAWMARIAAIGHGEFTQVDAADAFARANSSTMLATDASQPPIPEGFSIGEAVAVSPLEEHSPAHGVLAYVDDHRISLTVSNDFVAALRVHFPRSGYRLSRPR